MYILQKHDSEYLTKDLHNQYFTFKGNKIFLICNLFFEIQSRMDETFRGKLTIKIYDSDGGEHIHCLTNAINIGCLWLQNSIMYVSLRDGTFREKCNTTHFSVKKKSPNHEIFGNSVVVKR